MPGSILGNAVRRVEDPDLLMGRGTFIDNLAIEGLLRVAFVRSPLAHARTRWIDPRGARGMPGVFAVYPADAPALPPLPPFMAMLRPECIRTPLATGKVRFVGDPVV